MSTCVCAQEEHGTVWLFLCRLSVTTCLVIWKLGIVGNYSEKFFPGGGEEITEKGKVGEISELQKTSKST